MISVNMSDFALVLAVVCSAVAVSLTLSLRQRLRELASSLSTIANSLSTRCEKLERDVTTLRGMSPTVLAARVEELSEAVERLRVTHRKFAGRVDQRLGRAAPEPDDVGDDDVAAILALQSAPSAGPSNGGA